MNRLPLHRVDEIFRHFNAGLGIRATARATATARPAVRRYYRLWRQGVPLEGTLACRLPRPIAANLATLAAAREEPPSLFASRLLEEIVGQDLVDVVLA